jgi:hypothetical protein
MPAKAGIQAEVDVGLGVSMDASFRWGDGKQHEATAHFVAEIPRPDSLRLDLPGFLPICPESS